VPKPRENILLALSHNEPYWLPCPIFDSSVLTLRHGLAEQRANGVDDWGVRWALRDPKSGPYPVSHPLTSPDQVEDYPMPDPDSVAIEVRGEPGGEAILAGDNGWGLFERSWLLVGMNRLFRWSRLHPWAVERLVEKIAEVKTRLTERLVEEAGVEMIMYGDDWGSERDLLFSPDWWLRFIYPWQRRLYEAAKRHGVLVYQHSDGRVERLVPYLVEAGVDVLNIQRECNDWRAIHGRYGGRLTLWGGVSARTLDVGSPGEIALEVRECAEMGRFGGLVLAPGHSLRYPEDNLRAMREAWLRYGLYRASAVG